MLRRYEMILRHEKERAMFVYRYEFEDNSEEKRQLAGKLCRHADEVYRRIRDLGFKVSSCNFDPIE